MSLAPALFLTSATPCRPSADFATTGSNDASTSTTVCHVYQTPPHSLLCLLTLIFYFLSTTHPHKRSHAQVATMSGISGHLVRRGAQMAQVHFTKVTTEQAPEHGSAPAMDFDPMDYLPSAIVAIVTALLIASVSSTSLIATAPGRILTNDAGPLHGRRSNCLPRND